MLGNWWDQSAMNSMKGARYSNPGYSGNSGNPNYGQSAMLGLAGLFGNNSIGQYKPPSYGQFYQPGQGAQQFNYGANLGSPMQMNYGPNFGRATSGYNYQDPYNVGQSNLYGGLNRAFSGFQNGQTGLSPAYNQAVMNQGLTNLNTQRNLLNESAAFDANRYNVLGSGSLGVRQGLNDQEYMRQAGNLANQLTQSEFGQSNNIMSMLGGLENQRAGQSAQAQQLQQGGAGLGLQAQQLSGNQQIAGNQQQLGAQQQAFGQMFGANNQALQQEMQRQQAAQMAWQAANQQQQFGAQQAKSDTNNWAALGSGIMGLLGLF